MAKSFDPRELHSPRKVRRRAHDLPVDKVADPAEGEEKGRGDGDLVCEAQERFTPHAGEHEHGDDASEENSVGRHATPPVTQDLPGMVGVVAPLVDENGKQPAEEENTESRQDGEVIDVR